jgi:hypothetical protein
MVDRRLTGAPPAPLPEPRARQPPRRAAVHGLTDEFLADKPLFAEIADELMSSWPVPNWSSTTRLRRRLPRTPSLRAWPGPRRRAWWRRSPTACCWRASCSRARQLAGRAVQAARGRQLQPHAARRAARRRAAGRGLHPHDARPGLAGDRRGARPRRRRGRDHRAVGLRAAGAAAQRRGTGRARARCWPTSTRPVAASWCGRPIWHNPRLFRNTLSGRLAQR